VAPLVSEYYVLLRSTLRAKPHLRKCLCRCRHCRIFFLTHPRNAGRRDLGCSFGCRQEHRRRESIRRGTEYYQGEQGREYKRRQNQRQRGQVEIADPKPPKSSSPPLSPKAPCPAGVAEALPAAKDPEVVEHARVVISLIEDRPVSLEELWEMLARVLRQRSMPQRRPIDHAVLWLNENPP
jgi:hypothetical protein